MALDFAETDLWLIFRSRISLLCHDLKTKPSAKSTMMMTAKTLLLPCLLLLDAVGSIHGFTGHWSHKKERSQADYDSFHKHSQLSSSTPVSSAFTDESATKGASSPRIQRMDPSISRRGVFQIVAATLLTTSLEPEPSHARSISQQQQRLHQQCDDVQTNSIAPSMPTSIVSSSKGSKSAASSSTSSLEESISGFVAGATMSAAKTVVKFPLDTATVRLQMPNQAYGITNLPALFDGAMNGVATPLVAGVPGAAVFFAVRDACKQGLRTNPTTQSWPSWVRTSIAVGAAQVPYWIVRNPSEVVKTRQQANLPGYGPGTSMVEGYAQVQRDALASRSYSLRQKSSPTPDDPTLASPWSSNLTTVVDAFYVGFWENIAYAYPADVLKFLLYDQWTASLGGKTNVTPLQGAIAGAGSTAVAQFLTTPLDVVRNRLMANSVNEEGDDDNKKVDETFAGRRSYWGTLKELAETEGLPGLFAGASPRVGKALISGAIQFATYEETKKDIAKLLQGSFPKKQ